MLYRRSCKIYFSKWITERKRNELREILSEFARIQTYFADNYENVIPEVSKFTLIHAEYINKAIKETGTFFSARMVKQAFADAYGQIQSAKSNMKNRKNIYYRPSFSGKRMLLSECAVHLEEPEKLKDFDLILKLWCLRIDKGRGYKIFVPLKKHRMFNYWNNYKDEFNPNGGKRSSSLFVTDKYVQIFWAFESGNKKEVGDMIGVDFGLHSLFTLSDGRKIGCDILKHIEELKRKKYQGRSYYRKKQFIREYLNRCIKEIGFSNSKLIVIEDLRGMKKHRGRLLKNIRSVLYNISIWQIRTRIKQLCENNRVSFHTVLPFYTSQECFCCGHIEKTNRKDRDNFKCQNCGHSDDADINASKVILKRYVMGRYGSHYQQEFMQKYNFKSD